MIEPEQNRIMAQFEISAVASGTIYDDLVELLLLQAFDSSTADQQTKQNSRTAE